MCVCQNEANALNALSGATCVEPRYDKAGIAESGRKAMMLHVSITGVERV